MWTASTMSSLYKDFTSFIDSSKSEDLSYGELSFLVFLKFDDKKMKRDAQFLLDNYRPLLDGKFNNGDGTLKGTFNEGNWGNNGSLLHRLFQGPERHGDVQNHLLEFYLSKSYLSKCSVWISSMAPEDLLAIERKLWG